MEIGLGSLILEQGMCYTYRSANSLCLVNKQVNVFKRLVSAFLAVYPVVKIILFFVDDFECVELIEDVRDDFQEH